MKKMKYDQKGLLKCQQELSGRLNRLEASLKNFRSTSPEKWIKEQGKHVISSRRRRSNNPSDIMKEEIVIDACDASTSEEVIKTIAENENFIKQKVGGIEEALCTFSSKFIPEGIETLLEDARILQEGTKGLSEMINSKKSMDERNPELQEGFSALYNGLQNIAEDAGIVMDDTCLDVREEIQAILQESVEYLEQLRDQQGTRSINENIPLKDIHAVLTNIHEVLKDIVNKLEHVQANSSVLDEVQKKLEEAQEELKSRTKKLFECPTKINEKPTDYMQVFADLREEDFGDIDSMVGYEIADFILRREEREIETLREEYAKRLSTSK